MLDMTGLVVLTVLAVPYTPLASVPGFKALFLSQLGVMIGLALTYFAGAEATKRWFSQRFVI